MMRRWCLQLLLSCCAINAAIDFYQPMSAPAYQIPDRVPLRIRRRTKGSGAEFGKFFGEIPREVATIGRNIFLWDTFKIAACAFPCIVAASMLDNPLHSCFYDKKNHRNCNQPPRICVTAANYSIHVPLVYLAADGLLSSRPEKFYTGKILLLGSYFVAWTKKICREIKWDACCRPWNEHFSSEKRSYGGFPSGHMAQAVYAAMLYSLQFGEKYAVPLGSIAAFLGATYIACNRHYLSQLVSGAAFGTVYAVAANKLINSTLTNKLHLSIDKHGIPKLTVALKF